MNNQKEEEMEKLVKDFLSKPKNIVKSTQGFSETPIEAAERIFRAGLKAGNAASTPSSEQGSDGWISVETPPGLNKTVDLGWLPVEGEDGSVGGVDIGKLIDGKDFGKDEPLYVNGRDGWRYIFQPTHWRERPTTPQSKE